MLKRDELSRTDSCLNRAKDDELIFILLERDDASPVAVEAWIEARIALGKNRVGDEQIQSAYRWLHQRSDRKG